MKNFLVGLEFVGTDAIAQIFESDIMYYYSGYEKQFTQKAKHRKNNLEFKEVCTKKVTQLIAFPEIDGLRVKFLDLKFRL